MQKPPTPLEETQRLNTLREYAVLDTDPEQGFDNLTELVSMVLDVPIALVSLVDETRQWFKSHHGLDASETPREIAFCAHAICGDDVMIVENTLEDQRFVDNPLVAEDPNIRFYAGAPLVTNAGYKLGTICAIDRRPRELTRDQTRFLQIVSEQVVAQLELRKNEQVKNDLITAQDRIMQRLETANQEVRDLVTIVAHDLRAPVLNISGFADECFVGLRKLDELIASNEQSLPPEFRQELGDIAQSRVRESVEFIEKSAESMLERVNAINNVTKCGRHVVKIESIDLDQSLRVIADSHAAELREIKGVIEFEQLPPIEFDKLSIEILMENLVANAIKYRSSDRDLRIVVTAVPQDDGVLLTVADNGRGIAKGDISKAFAMFRRVGKLNTTGDGTGLTYCRAIVERFGGRLWCESELGKGSQFHCSLPDVANIDEVRLAMTML